MTSALVADSVVSICGALGLFVAIATLRRRDPRGALTRRLVFALGLAAALFLIRGGAWWSGSDALERLALFLASLLPVAALLVTEGMLRRHAPTLMKALVAGGAAASGIVALLDGYRLWDDAQWFLAGFQLATFLACAGLLWRGDDGSLTAAERIGVGRLAIAALLVIPFLLSDYRAAFPFVPVKVGALGSLLVVTIMLYEGESENRRRRSFLILGLRTGSATALGVAAAMLEPDATGVDVLRFCAVAVAGVLAISLLADTVRSALASRSPGLLAAIAASQARDRNALLAELSAHPLFAAAKRLKAEDLKEFDPPILASALRDRTVLRGSEKPWGFDPHDPAAERIAALIATHSATHLVVMQSEPLDLLLIAAPVVSAGAATETALLLVRRLLAMSPAEEQ
jgi:hypothetical protein